MDTQRKSLKTFLKPLLMFSTISGVGTLTTSRLCRIYNSILIFFYIATGIEVILDKSKSFYGDKHDEVVQVLHDIVVCIVWFGVFSTTIATNFLNRFGLGTIFELMETFESTIGAPTVRRKLTFWTCLVIERALVMTVLMIHLYIGFFITQQNVEVIVSGHFANLNFVTAQMLIFWLSLELSDKFAQVNATVVRSFEKFKRSRRIFGSYTTANVHIFLEDIRKITNLNDIVCEGLDIFNKIFGVTMVFEIMLIIVLCLRFSSSVIFYKINAKANDFGILLLGIWTVEVCFKVFLLALSGDRIARNAQDVIPICYRILHQIDSDLLLETHLLKKELKALIKQTTHRKPCLDAAGFFVVNFNMLGFVVTSFTTYIIVAIQFLLSDKTGN